MVKRKEMHGKGTWMLDAGDGSPGPGAAEILKGTPDAEIAKTFGVSPKWVQQARYKIQKLGRVTSRTAASKAAQRTLPQPHVVQSTGLAERLMIRSAEILGPVLFEEVALEVLEKALARDRQAVAEERDAIRREVEILRRENTSLKRAKNEKVPATRASVSGE